MFRTSELSKHKNFRILQRFRFFHNVSLDQTNQDLLITVLESWECKDDQSNDFSWLTDVEITRSIASVTFGIGMVDGG